MGVKFCVNDTIIIVPNIIIVLKYSIILYEYFYSVSRLPKVAKRALVPFFFNKVFNTVYLDNTGEYA